MHSNPIIVEQHYPAPLATVWQAITKVEQMRQWYFETITTFEATIGFETRFNVENEGQIYPHLWKIIVVIPQNKIAYTWRYGGDEGDSIVTWELTETTNGTTLTLTHQGHDTLLTKTRTDPEERRASCEAGWRYFLCDSLKAYLQI